MVLLSDCVVPTRFLVGASKQENVKTRYVQRRIKMESACINFRSMLGNLVGMPLYPPYLPILTLRLLWVSEHGWQVFFSCQYIYAIINHSCVSKQGKLSKLKTKSGWFDCSTHSPSYFIVNVLFLTPMFWKCKYPSHKRLNPTGLVKNISMD